MTGRWLDWGMDAREATGRCGRLQPRGWFCRRGPHPYGTPCASVPRVWRCLLRPALWRLRL